MAEHSNPIQRSVTTNPMKFLSIPLIVILSVIHFSPAEVYGGYGPEILASPNIQALVNQVKIATYRFIKLYDNLRLVSINISFCFRHEMHYHDRVTTLSKYVKVIIEGWNIKQSLKSLISCLGRSKSDASYMVTISIKLQKVWFLFKVI